MEIGIAIIAICVIVMAQIVLNAPYYVGVEADEEETQIFKL